MVLLLEEEEIMLDRIIANSVTPLFTSGRVHLSSSTLSDTTHLHSSTPLYTSQSSPSNWEFPMIFTDAYCFRAQHKDCFKLNMY